MAGRGGPTFLKRQKEQARAARANAKRAARQARRDDRATARESEAPLDEISPQSEEEDTSSGGNPTE